MRTSLLAPLSDSIPLIDEICWHTLSFTVDCLNSNCNLISLCRDMQLILVACYRQWVCNVMFCCERYQQVVTVDNAFNCSPSPNAIRNYCISQVSDDLQTSLTSASINYAMGKCYVSVTFRVTQEWVLWSSHLHIVI